MIHQKALLLLLIASSLVANAQRPSLNTTNTSNLLTEPFFVKPTSTSSRNAIPEMRSAGSKPDRSSYPDTQYSHGYIKEHPNAQAQPPRHQQNAINKLHKVDPARQRALSKVDKNTQQSFGNSNSKKGSFNILKGIANDPNHEYNQRSDNFSVGVIRKNEPLTPGRFKQDQNLTSANNLEDHVNLQPWPPNKAFNDLKNQLNNKSYLHTPSPPPYADDYDSDEKLGVKCTFEKPCAWTYDHVDSGSNFEVTTGANLTYANLTGNMTYLTTIISNKIKYL